MGEVHGKNQDHSVAGVALESWTRNVDIQAEVDIADVTCASAVAKAGLEGKAGWSMNGSYLYDNAAAATDPTLYDALMTGTVAVIITPGGGSASASNPSYTGSAVVTDYKISIPHDGEITCTATYQGTGTLTRSIA